MTPPRDWLKPPRSLLLILFLLTLGSVSALGWFGWKLLEQERVVEAQHAQERIEEAADRIAAGLRGALADTGDKLGAWLSRPPTDGKPEDGVLLIFTENSLAAYPPGRLLYFPYASQEPEAPPDAFAEGETLEFLEKQPGAAADWYRHLAESADPAVQAGALMRLGRVWRRLGNDAECRKVYAALAGIKGVRVAGAPAELVARDALRDDPAGVRQALLGGRWQLTRGQFEFYWSQNAGSDPPPADSAALAEAASKTWDEREERQEGRGQTGLWAGGRPFLVIWRGSPGRRAALLTSPEAVLRPLAGEHQMYAAVDAEGRLLAGKRSSVGRAAIRTAAEIQLPWTLYVSGTGGAGASGRPAGERFLLLGIAVMALFLIAGTYFIARAIRREMEVARMQSDFISAVSHEFRSPLTSMRQLSEILALGRAPSEERRQVYYQTLVRETSRLQRLVESLLNFGRMEAGARQFRFEELDTASLVERVVAEFEPQMAASGRHIEVHGAGASCRIEADPDALSVALRNLVDNALKYSPDEPTVWVEWGPSNHHVAIRVRDRGAGITAAERKAIFRKFVRGSAAAAANVRGSGVGLAMVRHIVAAHGGEIQVESEPGKGSTFTLLLPSMERA